MLSADSTTPLAAAQALYDSEDDEAGPAVSLTDVLIWLGERKALIGAVTGSVAVPLLSCWVGTAKRAGGCELVVWS